MKFGLKCFNLHFKKNKPIKFEPTWDWLTWVFSWMLNPYREFILINFIFNLITLDKVGFKWDFWIPIINNIFLQIQFLYCRMRFLTEKPTFHSHRWHLQSHFAVHGNHLSRNIFSEHPDNSGVTFKCFYFFENCNVLHLTL